MFLLLCGVPGETGVPGFGVSAPEVPADDILETGVHVWLSDFDFCETGDSVVDILDVVDVDV